MCKESSILYRFSCCLAVLPALLSMFGGTLLWPQNSEPLSTSSAGHLTAWEQLSAQFDETLSRHEATLRALSKNLEASENSGARLTCLSAALSRQNERLKTYNGQIAERMQERDEDLAASYEANDRKDKTILKLIIAVIVLGIPYLVKSTLWIAGKLRS